jgi:hypothetical protein
MLGFTIVILEFAVFGGFMFFLTKYPAFHKLRTARKLTYVSPEYEELVRLLRTNNPYSEMQILECHLDDLPLALNLADNLAREPDTKGSFHTSITIENELVVVKSRYLTTRGY